VVTVELAVVTVVVVNVLVVTVLVVAVLVVTVLVVVVLVVVDCVVTVVTRSRRIYVHAGLSSIRESYPLLVIQLFRRW
jgi:hypothetical protein